MTIKPFIEITIECKSVEAVTPYMSHLIVFNKDILIHHYETMTEMPICKCLKRFCQDVDSLNIRFIGKLGILMRKNIKYGIIFLPLSLFASFPKLLRNGIEVTGHLIPDAG